jgi:hypothetical protein
MATWASREKQSTFTGHHLDSACCQLLSSNLFVDVAPAEVSEFQEQNYSQPDARHDSNKEYMGCNIEESLILSVPSIWRYSFVGTIR